MVVALQNQSGIPRVLQGSSGGAATPIVQIVQQRAVRHRHTLFMKFSKARKCKNNINLLESLLVLLGKMSAPIPLC